MGWLINGLLPRFGKKIINQLFNPFLSLLTILKTSSNCPMVFFLNVGRNASNGHPILFLDCMGKNGKNKY
jgi:hypothetical protein